MRVVLSCAFCVNKKKLRKGQPQRKIDGREEESEREASEKPRKIRRKILSWRAI
jgi:hypothetical protein